MAAEVYSSMAQDPFGQRDYFALWPYRPAQNFPRNAGGGWGTHYQGHQGQSHHQHYRHHHQHQHHHEHGRKRQRPSQDVPSLSDLRSANTAATRKHYRGSFGAPSPWISNAPAAPDNRSGFLLAAPTPLQGPSPASQGAGLHLATPSSLPGGDVARWRNGWGAQDQDAARLATGAGVDMLGTFCEGVDDDDDDDLDGFGLPQRRAAANGSAQATSAPEDEEDESTWPAAAKRKLASQAATIAGLEDNVLTLKERIFLLEQRLAEAQRQRPTSSSTGTNDGSEAHQDDTTSSSSQGRDAQQQCDAKH